MELVFLVVLIVLMMLALGVGYPVAFALPGSAILSIIIAAGAGWIFAGNPDAYFAQGGAVQWLSAGVTNLRGVYWEVERDTLIAIPLFIFMGIMLQRSRIAEELLVTMAQLFGPIPGGLGISVVFVGALLAATTGIVGATVVAMGLISLPAMLRHNYSKPLATGTIAASGTLGQIIPPSIVLIILADQLSAAVDQAGTIRKELYKFATGELSMPSEFEISSTSAGEMFLGAMVPGLVLVGLYMVFILAFALLFPSKAPPVPFEGRMDRRFFGRVALILVPPLTLILLVLGSIIAGIATVNQAGAIGATGALIMASYQLKPGERDTFWPAGLAIASVALILVITAMHPINVKNVQTQADVIAIALAAVGVIGLSAAIVWSAWRTYHIDDTLRAVMIETAKTTSLVFIILMGAAMLTAAFRSFGGEELVKNFLNSMPGGFWTKFIIVMAVIFILGFFLDFIEIAVVVVPIVAPILLADPSANVTAVWLGVMIGLNIQTSFLTPPFGFALFYLRGVAPAAVRTIDMYRGVIAFILLQLAALAIVAWNPPLVNYLPMRVSLTASTAPPPVNPRLQYCVEQYVAEQFAERGDAIRAAIEAARRLDLSMLPEDLAKDFEKSLEKAEKSFELMAAIQKAEAAVQARAEGYRPLLERVRDIEAEMRGLEREAKALTADLRHMAKDHPKRAEREARLAALKAEIQALKSRIPAEWEEAHKQFLKLTKAERKARMTYRRNVDDAYAPVAEIIKLVEDADALAALRPALEALAEEVPRLDAEAAMARIKETESLVGTVEGTRAIKRMLSKARRALRGDEPDMAKARDFLAKALEAFESELAWRQAAREKLLPGLREYEAAIRDTIGLRSQPRLPHEQALYVASCFSVHRDISLNF